MRASRLQNLVSPSYELREHLLGSRSCAHHPLPPSAGDEADPPAQAYHNAFLSCLCVDNADARLFTSSADFCMKLWEPQSMREVARVSVNRRFEQNSPADPNKPHVGKVSAACISEAHNLLLTGSNDTTIKVWSLGDLALRATLMGHTNNMIFVRLLAVCLCVCVCVCVCVVNTTRLIHQR